jgi:hypothetical protein
MTDWLVEMLRGRQSDRAKARQYLAESADASYRATMKDFDSFVPFMRQVRDPSILIGTAKDSTKNDIAVRIAIDEINRNWLVTGSTGSGKSSFVTSIFKGLLGLGYPVGIVDCKANFFDDTLRWAAAIAYRKDPARRAEFIRSLAVINPFGDALVPLNVCKLLPGSTPETRAYDVCLALSRLFLSDMGIQMANIMRHLCVLLVEADLTLVEAPLVMQDDLLRNVLLNRTPNEAVKDFFLRSYPSIPSNSKLALLTRLQNLLLAENIRLMLGADNLIDFKSILDLGHPLFVFLGKGPGVPEEEVDILASLDLR